MKVWNSRSAEVTALAPCEAQLAFMTAQLYTENIESQKASSCADSADASALLG